MAVEVFMPKAGMDMHEGTIIRWLADVGDCVRQGEPLLEIETDKVTMDVEAPADGVLLRKYFEEGSVVPVVTIIGYVGQEGEAVPEKPSMAGGTVRAADEELLQREAAVKEASEYEYRMAVIGGGSAGVSAALRAASFGGKVILFEKSLIGGSGLNLASIPLLTYMRNARLIEACEKAAEIGIRVGDLPFQPDAVMMGRYRRKIEDQIR